MCAAAYEIQHALAVASRCGQRLSLPALPESPRQQRIAVVRGVGQPLPEVYRNAAVVYDEGGSDAAIFAQQGMPSIALGCGSIAQAHTRDEFISVEDLEKGAAFFADVLSRL